MLIGAAACPHPPVLVPAAATGAAAELDSLRAACDEAVRRLVADRPDVVIVVGGGPATYDFGATAAGGLQRFGVDLTVGSGPLVLPPALAMGRWLLERNGASASRLQAVAEDAPPHGCLALGAELAASADRVALLVMADGSACRTEKAPGYLDERAEPFDELVASALADGDIAALARLDATLAAQVMATGRAAWQVLAGAADGQRLSAELLARQAPYGVGYLVAGWKSA